FLLTLYTQPKLVQTLRTFDSELQRQLIELEALGPDGAPTKVVEAEIAKAQQQSQQDVNRILGKKVAELEFSEGVNQFLQFEGIITVGDLVSRTEENLFEVSAFGEEKFRE